MTSSSSNFSSSKVSVYSQSSLIGGISQSCFYIFSWECPSSTHFFKCSRKVSVMYSGLSSWASLCSTHSHTYGYYPRSNSRPKEEMELKVEYCTLQRTPMETKVSSQRSLSTQKHYSKPCNRSLALSSIWMRIIASQFWIRKCQVVLCKRPHKQSWLPSISSSLASS